jgi:EAL domain-containing protein (putative c-di-GMP-specific phosphodiesterase class I)
MKGQGLRKVLERVIAHYQPIVDLGTGAVIGFEMLARIGADEGPPQSIGPLIEEIESDPGHLERLMRQLLTAIQRDMQPLFARYPDFYVSVNVPPVMLGDGRIRKMIQELGLGPCLSRLVCEVTERQALTDVGRAALETARKLHVRIAMDDFGTGHSGLGQLLGQTFDVLKIDRSQIEHLMKDPTADRLLRGIVALANVLRARTVAEGVETAAQAFFLQAVGVDYGQGWFWSKALPAAELPRAIESGFGDRQRALLARLHGAAKGS